MEIDEAIKLQNELVKLLPEVGFNKYIASAKLGIEALKAVKKIRRDGYWSANGSLPGETKE